MSLILRSIFKLTIPPEQTKNLLKPAEPAKEPPKPVEIPSEPIPSQEK